MKPRSPLSVVSALFLQQNIEVVVLFFNFETVNKRLVSCLRVFADEADKTEYEEILQTRRFSCSICIVPERNMQTRQ